MPREPAVREQVVDPLTLRPDPLGRLIDAQQLGFAAVGASRGEALVDDAGDELNERGPRLGGEEAERVVQNGTPSWSSSSVGASASSPPATSSARSGS